ncbi:MAG: sigma-70 family RNA polymerase sigma factor [Verrucomicrobia bacterium]|jgi:RNA polymerase sigma-70 factor (ECF subfamily)|nr:sigma-70 family RNA polymerase sigma factor [Verrucomicrobiota bacterium]
MRSKGDADARLMRRVQRGDREAFAELVERYKQPIYNFILRTVRDETEAEDLTQNTFVQVWKAARGYRVSARFSTWLYTIARNLALNELRRRGRHRAESLDAAHPEFEEQPLHQLEDRSVQGAPDELARHELFAKVEEAIADLPENQRTALLLCREEDVSYEDIAKILGVSLSATKSIIHRAREVLRTRLKAYLRTGDWTEEGRPKL